MSVSEKYRALDGKDFKALFFFKLMLGSIVSSEAHLAFPMIRKRQERVRHFLSIATYQSKYYSHLQSQRQLFGSR
jgi:hypothetical protein